MKSTEPPARNPDAKPTVKPSQPFTDAQQQGIVTVGQNLLVSAGAGSGKTQMLSERCVHLICDAEPAFRCEVDQLLVVTFTESAAREMRHRIRSALQKRATQSPRGPSEELTRQLQLIDQAQISTLHGFCARLLRQHFNLVDLDPGFTVMDADEAKLLRIEIARELFQERYEQDKAGDFQSLVDAYADGDDERLLQVLLRAHDMLNSLLDPAGWMDEARAKLARGATLPLVQSDLGGELLDLIGREFRAFISHIETSLHLLKRLTGFSAYELQLQALLVEVRDWETSLGHEPVERVWNRIAQYKSPRRSPISNSVPNKDRASKAMDTVKEALTKGRWRNLLRFTEQQWLDGMRQIVRHADTLLKLVGQFGEHYRRAKDAERQLDFADLERYAFDVLRDRGAAELRPSQTALAFQRQFKHVLVDEYQDINELQDAILSLVSCESRSSAVPNLFVVGDVKQSIYRFRLAEPTRFLDRERLLRDAASGRGKVIDLQANFRSRGPLLDAINAVFERLMTSAATEIDYNPSHRLTAGQAYPDAAGEAAFAGAPIELHLLPDKLESEMGEGESAPSDDIELDRAQREAALIARQIHEWMGHGSAPPMRVLDKTDRVYRRIEYRDIVILLRSMRFKADRYAQVLRDEGIPVHSESVTGYFESVEVRDMLALLALLENQRQDIPLATVIRSPIGLTAAPEDAMARVRLAYSDTAARVPFHQAVVRYAHEHADDLSAQLKEFLGKLQHWRELAHRRPLAEMIWTIYVESGYLTYVSGLAGGEQRVANLMYLHERAEQFGGFHRQGLSRFLDFLESLRDEADLGMPSVASQAENVVRIMSVHRAKGQEFPVVVLPDLGKTINTTDCQGSILFDRKEGLGMTVTDEEKRVRYPSLCSTIVEARIRRQMIAEELRVLYVAMTRAREHVVLVGTCANSAWEDWQTNWASFAGALPADKVVGASRMLDWIGPVAAAAPSAIRVTTHPPEVVAGWSIRARRSRDPSLRLSAAADLAPLDPAPLVDAVASRVIDRFTFVYPFEAFTELRAARSVTSMVGHGESTATAPDAASAPEFDSTASPLQSTAFSLPRFVQEVAPRATDIGTATHVVLEHLDYSRSIDRAGIEAQIDKLVERRVIDAAHGRLVDRDAILWFLDSAAGRLMRANVAGVRHEIPISFTAAPDAALSAPPASREDAVMVRGRLDVLVESPEGLTVIDYKTDAVDASGIPARAATYRPQVDQYCAAIFDITGQSVARAYLVFLKPRIVWDVLSDSPIG